MFGGEKWSIDEELWKNGGIDMKYGRTTKKLVKDIQSKLGFSPRDRDGKAGPKFFEAVLKYFDGEENWESRGQRAGIVHRKRDEKLERGSTSRPEISAVKQKLNMFMSGHVAGIESVDLSEYHFDTVKWWRNIEPNPELVVEEIQKLGDRHSDEMLGYLKANPAEVKKLQQYLNDRIEDDHIDITKLKAVLAGTWMDLKPVPGRWSWFIWIREDWMLGPQTYAAICCFREGCYPYPSS